MANSDVKLKHKVQLRKKVEEPAVTVGTEDTATSNTPNPNKSGSKTWLWILLGVIALGVICFFIFSKSDNTDVTEPEQETEIVEEAIAPTDTLAEEDATSEEVLSTDGEDASTNANQEEAMANEPPSTPETVSSVPTTTSPIVNADVSNDVEAEAMKVIRGDYGIGQERKAKLGSKYQTIQSRVNELKREGIF